MRLCTNFFKEIVSSSTLPILVYKEIRKTAWKHSIVYDEYVPLRLSCSQKYMLKWVKGVKYEYLFEAALKLKLEVATSMGEEGGS